MRNDNRLSFLKVILNLILLGTILSFVGIISYALVEGNRRKIDTILRIVMGIIFSGGYFVIVFTLKKILESIRKKDPFSRDNIVYFKRIGYYIFIVGVMGAVLAVRGASMGLVVGVLLYFILTHRKARKLNIE